MSVALYRRFRAALKELPAEGRMMPYRWSGLPKRVSAVWMPYGLMLDEFADELANSINDLTLHVQRLRAWSTVVAPMSDRQQLEAAHEFVDVLGTVALNLPYVIRSRFIFAATHLCHQANLAKEGDGWRDDLPLDSEIYLDVAQRYGAEWRKFGPLKRALEGISGKDYKRGTHDFRHAYNHRFSPRFVVGETQFVTRRHNAKTGATSYAMGGLPPLDLAAMADLLALERDRCYRAFDVFVGLVREHEAAIEEWQASDRRSSIARRRTTMSHFFIQLRDVDGEPVAGGLYLVKGDRRTAERIGDMLLKGDLHAITAEREEVKVEVPLELEEGDWIRLGVELNNLEWDRVYEAWVRKNEPDEGR